MRNFKVTIAFDGGHYGGWQRQINSYSVQHAVEDTLKKILKKKVVITGCSRTDGGVHANGYVFNFLTDDCTIPLNGLFRALHTALPLDIVVVDVAEVSLNFSARYHAVAKQYIYVFQNSTSRDPFLGHYSLHVEGELDDKLMNIAAAAFLGRHDFSAFRSTGFHTTTSERTIYESFVRREGDMVTYTVTGDGFLYNMVRIMAGTLYFISLGKIGVDAIGDILLSQDRERAGKTLPPHGLYLNKVFYDNTHDICKIPKPQLAGLLNEPRKVE